jgi:methyl-accepting chemotaxis protein-2 (aspartate sensor receptor)
MYQALIHQKSYSGVAILFGRDYDTYYAPLTDERGKLSGAIFVGHQQ